MKKELSYYELVKLISEIKEIFEKSLEKRLTLIKVQSPLFIKVDSGLQDDLNGVEKAVSFIKGGEKFEIVHSLAKWKRDALYRYQFKVGEGILTDMKAIRKDEIVDEIHSMYVEQWDWEKVIRKEERTIDYLKDTVSKIYKTIRSTVIIIRKKYPFLDISLPKSIYFISSLELEEMYPDKTPREREDIITKEKKAVFIIGVGDKLKSGIAHDTRSPDYDDWRLNGDLLIYDKVFDRVIEISSMGIRVDKESLLRQLHEVGSDYKIKLPYHQMIIKEELPFTIGGGIGISRVLLLILEKHHIGEIQASSWEDKTYDELKDYKIL